MIPTFDELIDPLLKLVSKNCQTRKNATLELEKILKISDEQINLKTNSGNFIFENRVGWAFTYLTKAEYIKKTDKKGTYQITELGLNELQKNSKNSIIIDKFYLENNSPNYFANWQVNKLEEKNKDFKKDLNMVAIKDDDNPAMNLERSIDEFNNQFEIDLLDKIKNIEWQEFENICAKLIEKMGYGIASTRNIRVRDNGIDGEIFEDELGLNGIIYIQAKRYSENNVGVNDMKSFLHTIRNHKGIFITTSDFTKDAKSEALSFKGKIALINKDDLIKYCKKYEIECSKQTIEIFKTK